MVVKPKCCHFTWILRNWATTGDVMTDQEGKFLKSNRKLFPLTHPRTNFDRLFLNVDTLIFSFL